MSSLMGCSAIQDEIDKQADEKAYDIVSLQHVACDPHVLGISRCRAFTQMTNPIVMLCTPWACTFKGFTNDFGLDGKKMKMRGWGWVKKP